MKSQFRYFRIHPYMGLWDYIKDIRKLQSEGILNEECPSPTFWTFSVNKFEEIPDYLKREIINSGQSY